MTSFASSKVDGWGLKRRASADDQPVAAAAMLRIVDAGLCGVIFVAPYFFGGRHDMGRLLLVAIIAVTAAAWFIRQAMLPAARWPRTVAYAFLLLTIALVAVQIVPLPEQWINRLAPRTGKLFPLWSGNGAANLGTWQTLSLIPHETTKCLAMLLSYCLLFVVVAGRIEEKEDAQRLLRWIGISAAIMAAFGLLQYSTSDGRFFWFYWHPHRFANMSLSGPFINRNHFADFLALGTAPLLAWLLSAARHYITGDNREKTSPTAKDLVETWAIGGIAALVVMTILITGSRGGAVALLVVCGVMVAVYLCRGLADSRFLYGLFGFAVVIVGLLSIHGYDQVAKRLDDFTDGSMDDIDQGGIRRKLWAANVTAFEAGWLTGAGAGSHCEVCPVYLPESYTKEYTHAENGYLQIATENGIGGLLLLAGGLALCGVWCIGGIRRATDSDIIRLLGACAAGLAASAAHSVCDFVWYIPGCITITIILAACALRLSQLSQPAEERVFTQRTLRRGRWMELAAAAIMIGGWCIHTYIGPGIAAIHWDRYLRASVANSELSRQRVTALVENQQELSATRQIELNNVMLSELEQVVHWEPQFARAHLRLAARSIAQFDDLQQESSNAMTFGDIRDTLATTGFATPTEQIAWLNRAFGANLKWLRRAENEARIAASLCPLQGEAYVYLAQLSFLNHAESKTVSAYIDQGLRVRPQDASVLFEVGRQDFIAGNTASAVERWKQCFDDTGPHQLKIVYLLAARITAREFLETFKPDWRTLRGVWTRYHDSIQPADLDALLTYSTKCAEHEKEDDYGIPPAFVWMWQARFYADANRNDEALQCLERAYKYGPRYDFIRRALAEALKASGRYAEAEPHFRWCLARHPGDLSLSNALADITKQRLAERSPLLASMQQNRNTAYTAAGPPPAASSPETISSAPK